jgi:hypothetical protein
MRTGTDAPPARVWWREPLLHFIVVGALMFGAYFGLNRGQGEADAPRQIVLTADDVLQMRIAWRAQGRAEPTPQQLQQMVETKVREEVLYREALAMGLQNDDVIVKRRLAQKMDFLAEDLSTLREPTRDELQQWHRTHADEFALPPRASFRHLFFGFDQRGARAGDDAAAALVRIAGKPADAAGLAGDAFPLQGNYAERTPEQVAAAFGAPFARGLFALQPGAWPGPVESGFGWHLVFIEALTPGRVPDFDAVEAEVRASWQKHQRSEFKRAAYETMRAKYSVVLPPSDAASPASAAARP